MEAWRQWLLGGKRSFVTEKEPRAYDEPRIPLTPTGLLMEGHYAHRAWRLAAACSAVTTASAGPYTKHESKLVPAAIIVGFVDAHAIHKQANQKCEWGDHAMPKATPKARRLCIRFFVLGI